MLVLPGVTRAEGMPACGLKNAAPSRPVWLRRVAVSSLRPDSKGETVATLQAAWVVAVAVPQEDGVGAWKMS